jgi:hypothetical protein
MKQKCAACIQMASGKSEIMSEKTAVMSRALSHEWVSLEQLGEAIRKCSAAHPEYTAQRLLHPDAERLCEALAGMNYRKLNAVRRDVFQGEHLEALKRWVE